MSQNMFNDHETNAILTTFPQINMKCCNENIAKFHTNDNILNVPKFDFYSAIPEGKKYIIWFTSYNNKKACFLLTYAFKKLKIYKFFFKFSRFFFTIKNLVQKVIDF